MLRIRMALLTCVVLGSCSHSKPQAGLLEDPQQRDLILVSIDTLRASRLPFYPALHSEPKLDSAGDPGDPYSIAWLAAQGTVYPEVFASAGKTLPSLASFFTGLSPIEHGAISNTTRLQSATHILDLKQAGWKAHARVANRALHKFCGLAQGFDSYAVRAKEKEKILGDELLAAASEDIAKGERLLLWAHFMAPHQPYEPAPQYRQKLQLGPEIIAGNTQLKDAHRFPERHGSMFPAYRDLYDAEVATANEYVQDFLVKLDQQYQQAGRGSLLENAVVVFFSDHGEELGDRYGYFLHAKSLYRSVTQVPLIIVDGQPQPPSHSSDRIVDLSKTLEHLLFGQSMFVDYVISSWQSDYFAIRDSRFTLVHNPGKNPHGPIEPPEDVAYFYPAVALYDRNADPFEFSDVATRLPSDTARLGAALFDWYSGINAVDSEYVSGLDAAALAELGYAEDVSPAEDGAILGPWPPQLYEIAE